MKTRKIMIVLGALSLFAVQGSLQTASAQGRGGNCQLHGAQLTVSSQGCTGQTL